MQNTVFMGVPMIIAIGVFKIVAFKVHFIFILV